MGGGYYGGFTGTAGSAFSKFEFAPLPSADDSLGGLRAGNRLTDNMDRLKEKFPISKTGYFGRKGKGRSHTRDIESSNPARAAYEFALLAGWNPVTIEPLPDAKGSKLTMRDGSVVTYRYYSPSKDKSPAVSLRVRGVPGVKDQKIHFVLKGESNE